MINTQGPPPTRKLSTLMLMDPDVPGMQTYNIKHTIGTTNNPIVRNAPQYTVPIDWESRSQPFIYSHVDKDFAVSVVTPRTEKAARARIHPTQPNSYTSHSLGGRHFAGQTSKSMVASRKQQLRGSTDDQLINAKTKSGIKILRKAPKTARS
jgi:hypothetical protein